MAYCHLKENLHKAVSEGNMALWGSSFTVYNHVIHFEVIYLCTWGPVDCLLNILLTLFMLLFLFLANRDCTLVSNFKTQTGNIWRVRIIFYNRLQMRILLLRLQGNILIDNSGRDVLLDTLQCVYFKCSALLSE